MMGNAIHQVLLTSPLTNLKNESIPLSEKMDRMAGGTSQR
jgi:hypothetical protein